MQTHADQEHSHTARSENQGANATSQFADQRPAAASQNRLGSLAATSPQTAQLRAIQAMAGTSPGVETTQRFGVGQTATAQRQAAEEEDELQMKAVGAPEPAAQLQAEAAPRKNETGLPDNLKAGVESLSGMSMDNVRVHYNSSKPAQLNAYAYAQGTDIHVGPGQEKHLPHEAWHVVQQAQGRVKPTMQMKGGVPVNDDAGLEGEADLMGGKALNDIRTAQLQSNLDLHLVDAANEKTTQLFEKNSSSGTGIIQKTTSIEHEDHTRFYYNPSPTGAYNFNGGNYNNVANAGSRMVANLDRLDPKQGSTPSRSNVYYAAKNTTYLTNQPYVAGHLLNDGLGGLGINPNMVPITAKANTLHSGLEQNPKKVLARQPGTALAAGASYITYQIDVLDTTGTVGGEMASDQLMDCTFHCLAQDAGGNVIFAIDIESENTPTNLGPAWKKHGAGYRAAGTPRHVTYIPSVPAPGGGFTITAPIAAGGAVMPVGANIAGAYIQNNGTWVSFKNT